VATVDPFDRLAARTPPMAALAVAILAISTSAILIRLSGAPSGVKAFYRVAITTALVAPVAAVRHRAEFARLSVRDYGLATLSGLALALHFASWFLSVELTSVAASVTLVQSQPLFVAIGAWALLDERIGPRKLAGIGIALAGMVVMSVGDLLAGAALAGPAPLLGDALAVVGAACAAGYVLAGRSLRQRVSLLPYVTVVYVVCSVALLALALARGGIAALGPYPAREWLLFLAMALGPGIFGHTVINWALAHVESSVVSVTLLGEPVLSTLLALVVLAEAPSAITVAGGAVVLGGIYLTSRARDV
jgi:drug/metabolite transporter (DMT)-like permease